MKPFRLLVAGLIHDHAWKMLPQFARLAGVKIVGGADPNRPLREKLKREFGVSALFDDPRELFRRVEADAVLVCDSNAGGVPIVEEAAARGLDALVEKPMAATAEGARRMLAASRRHRTRLMVNWPIAWNTSIVRALELVKSGEIGHVFHARIHMAHQGPKEAGCTPYFYNWLYDPKENGAGALVDYCCYGAAVMATLWGKPRQVFGVARNLVKPKFPVDDNAMIVGLWPKRTALSQASWTQNPDFHDVLFLGVDGTLETVRGKLIHTHTKRGEFSHWGADRLNRRDILLPKPTVGSRNGPEHFVHAIRTGSRFMDLCSAEVGVAAQEILTAGLRSEKTGRRVNV
ncbi:MAG TPA: Gfo/Idh/MocA family oxidoreductase [Planctomycetota bacterium]|jgi:predicted dehydrogenase|nr:Gfo/Idh/MocA family oxidoreductase [Planctomycetota bacterium]